MAEISDIDRRPFSFPTIPQELIDLIIDALDDTSTLAAACTVCKAWLPSAQRRLVRTLVITWLNFPALLALADDPAWAPYVRRIENTVIPLVRKIAARTTIEALDLVIAAAWLRELDEIAHLFADTTYLRLHIFCPPSFVLDCESVAAFAARLPRLRTLSIQGHLKPAASLVLPPAAFPHLETLSLHMSPMDALLHWMMSNSTPALHSVSLMGLNSSASQEIVVSRFLRRLGPALQHLTIGTPNHFELDLLENKNLRTIYLTVFAPARVADTLNSAAQLGSLDTLEVIVPYRERMEEQRDEWRAIDAALQRFASRVCVRVRAPPAGFFNGRRDKAMQYCLPQSVMRGIVELIYSPEDE